MVNLLRRKVLKATVFSSVHSFRGISQVDKTAIKSAKRNVISLAGTPFDINDDDIFGSISSRPFRSIFSSYRFSQFSSSYKSPVFQSQQPAGILLLNYLLTDK